MKKSLFVLIIMIQVVLLGATQFCFAENGKVSDLTVDTVSTSYISLSWTAPESVGNGATYDLRYSTTAIDEDSWSNATPVSPQPSTSSPGVSESYTINNLSSGVTYYFALKSPDLSNVVSTRTVKAYTSIPIITAFSILPASYSLIVPITAFTATDDLAVVGYMVKESSETPSISDAGWTMSVPTLYEFTSAGPKTLYAWTKNVARKISERASANTTITLLSSDITAPIISEGSPTGQLSAGTTAVTLTVKTDEQATCRYSTTTNTVYASMSGIFSGTATDHSVSVSGLANGQSYSYYVRCIDEYGNFSETDYQISFSIASPVTPPAGNNNGSGSGSGSSGSGGGGGGGGGGGFTGINTVRSSYVVPNTTYNTAALYDAIPGCPLNFICKPIPGFFSSSNQDNSTGTTSLASIFTRDLSLGSQGSDVMSLQKYLNNHGFAVALTGAGSPGQETSYFGSLTQMALSKFQKAKGINPTAGYFGPITRAYIISHP